MDFERLLELLEQVRRQKITVAQAVSRLQHLPFEDLGFARVDHHRALRQGFPEVVLGLGKSPAQIASIASRIVERGQTLLITRADRSTFDAVVQVVPDASYHE